MKKIIVMPLIILILLVVANKSFAGAIYLIECKNEQCKFKNKVSFGGGFLFEQLTGYCIECRKFVYLTWTREGVQCTNSKTKPNPLDVIWDPSSGENRQLFACPDCQKPFMPIRSADELRFCPRCGQPTLMKEQRLLYD